MNSDTSRPVPPGRPRRPWPAPGTRVVVRRRLTEAEAATARSERRGAIWTDVIGFVLEASDDGVAVRTDPRPGRGRPEEIWIAADLVESVKPVPPRPRRRT
ncbi:hypothetical protein [Myceligenerans indicum]|uniref:Ferrous iron transport protein A n=1 Tax=Myceligenerans indicum TaxID=2593663 RepID=A0ABS1LK88_9MICO|nr:hypothetical protein [Myceligenerans indicum]MBL0886631.1 hypothetical protein [Myceligenerans indicum]